MLYTIYQYNQKQHIMKGRFNIYNILLRGGNLNVYAACFRVGKAERL
jgi:hypothetical protein